MKQIDLSPHSQEDPQTGEDYIEFTPAEPEAGPVAIMFAYLLCVVATALLTMAPALVWHVWVWAL